MIDVEWVAVDWGTSHVRAWAMSQENEVLAFAHSDEGMGQLAPNEFEPALLRLIDRWLTKKHKTHVIACGMVGAKQGWVEADYIAVPCRPEGPLTQVPVKDLRIKVSICSGLKQSTPTDVMRGEETQIAGLLAQQPEFNGVVCLPGTHTKWAQVNGSKVQEFQTFMTGELFALLSKYSVLRHSVCDSEWDQIAFREAVKNALFNPSSVASYLFKIRAGSLLEGTHPASAQAMLSGYLIGLELAAVQSYWKSNNVVIIGTDSLAQHYADSLRELGCHPLILESEKMTLKGLAASFHKVSGG